MPTSQQRSVATSDVRLKAGSMRSIHLRNLLSFGSAGMDLELRNLNVLVGPNGSGKSNLLEAIALLRGSVSEFTKVFERGGGPGEYVWKGALQGSASVAATFELPKRWLPLRHHIAFKTSEQRWVVSEEHVGNTPATGGATQPVFFYRLDGGRALISKKSASPRRPLTSDSVDFSKSILAQRKDPDTYPELYRLAEFYERVQLYREWTFGRDSVLRIPQKADLRTDRLEEDFSNLALYLKKVCRQPSAKRAIIEGLRDLYDGFTDVDARIEGGTLQVFFTEGDFNVPATRLSDGTIRYLSLLTILCDPDPPPLIGIEEPELGLHPDLMPKVADLLKAASERTQIIVTTHSDILIDALTEQPESVVITEKRDGQTCMKRLDANDLAHWLDKYRLGELWTRGELGGTRW
jgi:predicted ATPase